MRKIREIFRLRAAGKSQHLIALSVGIGQSTVGDYLTRARLASVGWPTPLPLPVRRPARPAARAGPEGPPGPLMGALKVLFTRGRANIRVISRQIRHARDWRSTSISVQ